MPGTAVGVHKSFARTWVVSRGFSCARRVGFQVNPSASRFSTLTRNASSPDTIGPPSAAANCVSRSEEHTSELQSLMRTSYAVFCLKKKNKHMTCQIYNYIH